MVTVQSPAVTSGGPKSSRPLGWTGFAWKVATLLIPAPPHLTMHTRSTESPEPLRGGRTSPCAAGGLGGGTPGRPQGRGARSQCCEQPVTAGRLPAGSRRAGALLLRGLPLLAAPAPGDRVPKEAPAKALSLEQAQDGGDLYPPSFRAWGRALALLACGYVSF